MKKLILFVLIGFVFSCSTDQESSELEPIALTDEQNRFITEYEYVTFKLDPNSSGAPVSEKWTGEVKLFLDGTITAEYRDEVANTIDSYNDLITDGTTIVLVDTFDESNVHLVLGDTDVTESLWPDMFSLIDGSSFSGYALYNYDSNFNINTGRIWVNNAGMPIFRHELGHILGFGHASSEYCGANPSIRSFMCSNLSEEFSPFDTGMVKTLYHPNITVGKNFNDLRPLITELLLSGAVQY